MRNKQVRFQSKPAWSTIELPLGGIVNLRSIEWPDHLLRKLLKSTVVAGKV
ncbi:hypothetical protein [Geobacter sp. SVR]|uniref:hypothetical protein n=1 Tax=Geobacter sp. SVR TaxID=2495594 RepID=UPI00143EF87F|nr:hypothetical protein [Geobacter sp. SVR]GCF86812.1 hypothetical protein GSbR_34120 [Geobacter sp. SVR]